MRRPVFTLLLTVLFMLALSSVAFGQDELGDVGGAGHDGGEGWWGETNDRVVTYAGFILIVFFPLFALVMSLLQGRLEKRKDRRLAAERARQARADARGGW